MRVIYIHQYFLTPHEGGATRSYYLAKGMVDHGIGVEMITAHNKPFYDLKIIDGIKVHYLPIKYEQEYGFFKRVWSFFAFLNAAKTWIKKLPRPDYLYITSTPLTTGLIGLWAKRKFALPYLFEVRDLWPDAPIQVGAIKNPILKKFLYALEKRVYHHALKVIALSPGIADNIRKKCPDCELQIVPNFADSEVFQPKEKSPAILKKYGLKNALTITYAGAIGLVNAVDEILDLAKAAQDQALEFQFVVMGKGSHLPDLLKKAKSLELKNFIHIPFGSKNKVAEILSASDIAFISFDHLPVLKTNSPNKFFDALASGKAIMVNHKGWVHDLVKSYHLGFYYNPKKPMEALNKLENLSKNPKKLREMQQNARKLSENYFTKERAIKQILHILNPGNFAPVSNDGVYILTA
ncbi:glycosyltransferase family 4 protein [Cecembia calidifontis]|uniref:Glycosyltransferase involved in cell wall biosynthesis n=1 Tax=Cecembia calidifontis TaxID=1187080 RepID=A0A4Q7P6P1_9BACT|nr:glycosyltransferase family 4 protein [Cecembia calidifontis]RZS95188.1 glycosyltransferase involved in cell wall biosynthesis [Cecembia calidifontis]